MKNIIFIFEGISKYDYDNLYMLKSLENRGDVFFEVWVYSNYKHTLDEAYLYNVSVENIVDIFELEKKLGNYTKSDTLVFTSICRGIGKGTLAFYRILTKCGLRYGAFSHVPYIGYHIYEANKKYVGATHYRLTPQNIIYDLLHIKNGGRQRLLCNIAFYFPGFLGIRKLDFIIISGKMSETSYLKFPVDKNTKRIYAHCNDTERFMLDNTTEKNIVCTFIDTAYFFSIDDDEAVKNHFLCNKESYSKKFCTFFDLLERKLGCSVIIAAHPRLNKEQLTFTSYIYGNRLVLQNKTIQLVKQSKLVLITSSSATKYAWLAQKPIHCITISEIEQTYFSEQIRQQSEILGEHPIHIDNVNNIDFNCLLSYNVKRYRKLIEDFCVQANTPNKLFWDIVLDKCFEEFFCN